MDGCWPETTFLKAEHPSKYLHSTLTAHFLHLKLCQVGGGGQICWPQHIQRHPRELGCEWRGLILRFFFPPSYPAFTGQGAVKAGEPGC